LARERIVDLRQHLVLDFAQRNRVIGFFAGQFLHWKFIGEIKRSPAAFRRVLVRLVVRKFWQKIFGRQMQPEFFSALQILAGLRRNFADRLVFYRTLEISTAKIAHFQWRAPAHLQNKPISEIAPQASKNLQGGKKFWLHLAPENFLPNFATN